MVHNSHQADVCVACCSVRRYARVYNCNVLHC
jgi:hypothetical protein